MHSYRVTVTPREAVSINDAGALIPDARLVMGRVVGGDAEGVERVGWECEKGRKDVEGIWRKIREIRRVGRVSTREWEYRQKVL